MEEHEYFNDEYNEDYEISDEDNQNYEILDDYSDNDENYERYMYGDVLHEQERFRDYEYPETSFPNLQEKIDYFVAIPSDALWEIIKSADSIYDLIGLYNSSYRIRKFIERPEVFDSISKNIYIWSEITDVDELRRLYHENKLAHDLLDTPIRFDIVEKLSKLSEYYNKFFEYYGEESFLTLADILKTIRADKKRILENVEKGVLTPYSLKVAGFK
jgi:hypothetical protein